MLKSNFSPVWYLLCQQSTNKYYNYVELIVCCNSSSILIHWYFNSLIFFGYVWNTPNITPLKTNIPLRTVKWKNKVWVFAAIVCLTGKEIQLSYGCPQTIQKLSIEKT